MLPIVLSILSLNVWGIPFFSYDRDIRINSISTELASGKYDIVSLQELWSQSDFDSIRQKLKAVMPFSHYFYNGFMGAGLCVFSKFPITATLFHSWSLNGYPHRIQHADWYGGKGVGLCKILVDEHFIHLYNAHLHAEYDIANDDYKTHRVIEAFDTAQFIAETRGNSVVQILAADLNSKPQDISYKTLLYTSKMMDTCLKKNICTYNCRKNSYTRKSIAGKSPLGKRIDHIFIRNGSFHDAVVLQYSLPLPKRIPGRLISYSDHEAILVKIKLTSKQSSGKEMDCTQPQKEVSDFKTFTLLQKCLLLCDASLEKLNQDRILYYGTALFLSIILIVVADYKIASQLKGLYLLVKFIFCAFMLFALFMGSLWNNMERNGILSGKKSMEVKMRRLEELNPEEE